MPFDARLLEILRCPACHGDVRPVDAWRGLECERCGRIYPVRDDIPVLAYGIRTWSDWNLAVCFLLSFAANVLIALFLALIGVVFAKKAKKGRGPQKVAASVKETAGVLQKAKPHPRPELPEDRVPQAIEAVARSSS